MLQDAHRKSDWVQKGVAFTGLSVATDPYTLGNTMYISIWIFSSISCCTAKLHMCWDEDNRLSAHDD